MKQVSAETALSKVGAVRHPTEHRAKAVSKEKTVYILHSQECLLEYEDLTECPYSVALATGDIDPREWPLDRAVPVTYEPGDLIPGPPLPIWELNRSDQWDRHRESNPGHTATVRIHGDFNDGIYCNTCRWHTYEAKEREQIREGEKPRGPK